ncbi:MAG: hypothetical protein ACI4TM_06650 [Candidatus Cryptobacteroides sp.]
MNKLNTLERLRLLIRHLVVTKEIASQKELGRMMGYKNESSFSQILNGKQEIPKHFRKNLKEVIPKVNLVWITTGEGEMLLDGGSETSQNESESSQVVQRTQSGDNINGQHVEISKTDSSKLLDVILQQSAQITKSQEQIDRLISIIERK